MYPLLLNCLGGWIQVYLYDPYLITRHLIKVRF